MSLYLDCDTTPALRGRYSRRRTIDGARRVAEALIARVTNGQIGIYASAGGGDFHGYIIKDYDGSIRYEPAEPDGSNARAMPRPELTQRDIKDYLEHAIGSFDHDPPDSQFLEGYLAALETVFGDNFLTQEERAARYAAKLETKT